LQDDDLYNDRRAGQNVADGDGGDRRGSYPARREAILLIIQEEIKSRK